LLGIQFNGFVFWRNRKSQSLNAKMINWHLMEDVLGWTAVLIGSIAMHFGDFPSKICRDFCQRFSLNIRNSGICCRIS
jgi:Co/Zn/Cd efflux system component